MTDLMQLALDDLEIEHHATIVGWWHPADESWRLALFRVADAPAPCPPLAEQVAA